MSKKPLIKDKKPWLLSNAYLVYHRKKTIIGPWSGHLHNIHFLDLKTRLLEKNLINLKTDLQAAQKQYSIPPSTTFVTSSRPKRDFNFDVNFDIGHCLASIVTGVVSLFFAPPSLPKIAQQSPLRRSHARVDMTLKDAICLTHACHGLVDKTYR